MSIPINERDVLTPKEVADLCAISLSMVYKLMKSGRLPYIEIGSLKRIRRCDVETFLTPSN